MLNLVESHGGTGVAGWWSRVQDHSLGWVAARRGGVLVGFVNVAWDGGDHAFLLDTKTRSGHQRRGIATNVVALATEQARAAGCEWLHVDFRSELAAFSSSSSTTQLTPDAPGPQNRPIPPSLRANPANFPGFWCDLGGHRGNQIWP